MNIKRALYLRQLGQSGVYTPAAMRHALAALWRVHSRTRWGGREGWREGERVGGKRAGRVLSARAIRTPSGASSFIGCFINVPGTFHPPPPIYQGMPHEGFYFRPLFLRGVPCAALPLMLLHICRYPVATY